MSSTLSNVIPFKKKAPEPIPGSEIDLFTAVDAAIRDLRDIARACDGKLREQADECQRMLERAFYIAISEA